MMGSDWVASGEESDARTIVGYLLLQKALSDKRRPQILIELLDEENVGLLGSRPGEVLISPLILSHVLAQVGRRRELAPVFDELFAAGSTEIAFRSFSEYSLTDRTATFVETQAAVVARGDIALGVRVGSIQLNPPNTRRYALTDEDEVIVISPT